MSGGGPPIERRPARAQLPGRAGWSPGWTVVHTTDGTFESACSWFGDPLSGVSAHYLVGLDGRVVQFVDEEDGAIHAGGGPEELAARFPTPDPNLHTIGIEFEDGGAPLTIQRPAAQYAAGARIVESAAERWGIPLDREHVIGHRELNPSKDCPGNLDVDRLIDEARGGEEHPLLAVLVPARNTAADLPGWLESAGRFADAVVALDDGSTDDTAAMLAASPLVARLLRNPVRPGYAGWDDAANRQALLDAAAEIGPRWVLYLDADERVDPEDGAALRKFLASEDALPGCAYGLRLHRAWDEHDVAGHTVVYRLFSPRPGQRLPGRRLHFDPVPDDVQRGAWVPTTVRARHLDSPERLAARLRKYAEADPQGDFERLTPRFLDEPDPASLEAWSPRPPGLPVLEIGTRGEAGAPPADRPLLAVLVPARDAAADLPGWLETVSRFADAVVALDDGSTDDTAAILAASPLVARLLRNPVRPGYAGWDDAANRQALLDAAAEIGPRWVLYLDADERIDSADGAALREFLESRADPGAAYGFRVFRMAGDERRYDQAGLWVYRLFSYRREARLPGNRLHLVPVPVDVPRDRWRKTTIRIKHLAGLDEPRRRRRFEKYAEADPERRWQRDYSNLLAEGAAVREWQPRPAGLPVLADPLGREGSGGIDLHELDFDAPILSAIVISRDDEDRIERCVRSVVEQECEEPFEVIVVVSGEDRTADIVRERFPQVNLVALPAPALPGAARNAGLAVARGDYVSFPGSHVELPPGSLQARVTAHGKGYAMVTGTILNGTETPAGWASYFLDHANVLPGRPSTELAGPPSHCSYVRDFVRDAGGFPEDMRTGEDTVVNRELWRRGLRAYRARDVRLVHRSPCADVPTLVRHHFRRGRGLGRIVLDDHRGGRPLLRRSVLGGLLAGYLPRRLGRIRRAVARWGGDLRHEYRRALPLIVVGAAAAWAGTWFEILRPAPGKPGVLLRDQRRPEPLVEDDLGGHGLARTRVEGGLLVGRDTDDLDRGRVP
ncbi:MAG TPA: glycosyltransferase [Solirubrobacterales bacterium]|nr:glycosyltransferase [Solirubrobacterales bacterium]